MTTPVMLPQMTAEQQATFNTYYPSTQRDEVLGVLLAVLLGSFGAHHFYLRRNGLGALYLVLFWTGIPAILGIIEAFFMPGRVREFNAIQAAGIAAALGIPMPGWNQPLHVTLNIPASTQGTTAAALVACPRCQQVNPPASRFCAGCGNTL